MKSNKLKKRKGYVLAVVMILSFVMTVTIISTFTIVVRYMTSAKNNLNDLSGTVEIYNGAYEEVYPDAGI